MRIPLVLIWGPVHLQMPGLLHRSQNGDATKPYFGIGFVILEPRSSMNFPTPLHLPPPAVSTGFFFYYLKGESPPTQTREGN